MPAHLKPDALGARVGFEATNAGLDERVEWDLVEFQGERARVDACQLEQIVDESGQDPYLVADGRQVLVGLGKAVLERFEHRLRR